MTLAPSDGARRTRAPPSRYTTNRSPAYLSVEVNFGNSDYDGRLPSWRELSNLLAHRQGGHFDVVNAAGPPWRCRSQSARGARRGQACSFGNSRRTISITKSEGPRDIQYPFLVSYPGPTIMFTVDSARVRAT